jgi:uncharacterized protein YbbC (DUF1343 family)
MTPRVQTGLDRLASGELDRLFKGRKIGLIANPTAIDSRFRHAIDLIHDRYDLLRLFGPEHGLRADAQDMIAVDELRDEATGLDVVSLYGHDLESLTPTPSDLDGIDVLVFDIQDVGARYYTYVWTMVLAMRAAAKAGIGFVVLDRPNPLGGDIIEGGGIEPGYESFVGLCSLPNQHGLTAGEIATWRKDVESLDVELEVVKMNGWSRSMTYEQTALPWVQPSPNMPTLDTALVYPGMCLIEGTEISEGRGTTKPFEIFGAPFIKGQRLADTLSAMKLPGVQFRALGFLPQFQKHAGVVCGGLQLHVTHRDQFQSYRCAVAILHGIFTLWPEQAKCREKAYEFVDDIPALDLLAGSPALREGLLDPTQGFEDIVQTFAHQEVEERKSRAALLMYS